MAAVLPLIVLVMFLVWGIKPRTDDIRTAVSADGIWVLEDTELMQTAVRLTGDVEYVPNALLTPQEFEGRTDIRIGQPGNEIQYATSRMRIRIRPGSYLICGYSVDFASRMYVNGKLLFEAGVPGDSRETTVPGVKYYQLPVSPDDDGEIVIVQQASNFTHKDGGTHGTLYIGMPEWINRYTFRNLWPEVILMGCYLVLFLVHFILYLMMKGYKPNLLFALFCLTWFLRTGVTGQRIQDSVLPGLPWTAVFRLEYLTMPLSGILLINLLSNANKHTGRGRVSIRVENLGTQLRVSVADNGDGISPELLPHVFERFRRGGEGGAGLGLTICRTIIEEHGGMIGAESAEGEGTRIWFTLPVKEGAEHE